MFFQPALDILQRLNDCLALLGSGVVSPHQLLGNHAQNLTVGTQNIYFLQVLPSSSQYSFYVYLKVGRGGQLDHFIIDDLQYVKLVMGQGYFLRFFEIMECFSV